MVASLTALKHLDVWQHLTTPEISSASLVPTHYRHLTVQECFRSVLGQAHTAVTRLRWPARAIARAHTTAQVHVLPISLTHFPSGQKRVYRVQLSPWKLSFLQTWSLPIERCHYSKQQAKRGGRRGNNSESGVWSFCHKWKVIPVIISCTYFALNPALFIASPGFLLIAIWRTEYLRRA